MQEIDRDGRISDFLEFFDLDEFIFVATSTNRTVTKGSDSLYAYTNSSGGMIESTYADLGRLVRTKQIDLCDEKLPLLTRLGLARIGGANEVDVTQLREQFLQSKRIPSPSISRISRCEFRARLNINRWWEEIDKTEQGARYIPPELKKADLESLFEWLFETDVDEIWKNAFLLLAKKVMFDERMLELGLKFLSTCSEFESFGSTDKYVVGRIIELYSSFTHDSSDVADVLFDELISGNIFYLSNTISPEILIDFIGKIYQDRRFRDDSRQIVDAVIDYISSDTANKKISRDLFWFVVDSELILEEYPKRSNFEGMTRLDRLILEFQTNSRFQLNLSDEQRDFFVEEVLSDKD